MASDLPPHPKWVAEQPSAFDIVTAFFPETKPKGDIRLRPCLVLDVLRNKRTGDIACRVAFGTKRLKLLQRKQLDIIIQNAADLDEMGLAVATRFDLDPTNLADLPWTPDFFGCWSGHSHPRLGTLMEKYARDYAYIMALRVVNKTRGG